MIAPPLNDGACLGRLTDQVRAAIGRSDVRELAERFASTAEVVVWIRSLAQRDDTGDPKDGPRVECDVPQRARVAPTDPNCVERSILYMALAEMIDPRPTRQLVTIETPAGRHTLPVENGEPIVLDANVRRNAARAAVWQVAHTGESQDETYQLLRWIVAIAHEEAFFRCGDRGVREVEKASEVFDRLLSGGAYEQFRTEEIRGAISFTLHAADKAADLWGPEGMMSVHLARSALDRLDLLRRPKCPPSRRNLRLRMPKVRELVAAGLVAQQIGTQIALSQLLGPAFVRPPTVSVNATVQAPPPPSPAEVQLAFHFPATPANPAGRRDPNGSASNGS